MGKSTNFLWPFFSIALLVKTRGTVPPFPKEVVLGAPQSQATMMWTTETMDSAKQFCRILPAMVHTVNIKTTKHDNMFQCWQNDEYLSINLTSIFGQIAGRILQNWQNMSCLRWLFNITYHDRTFTLQNMTWHDIYWLVVEPPLWKIWVSWDDDYSHYMESHKNHVPNHQPA